MRKTNHLLLTLAMSLLLTGCETLRSGGAPPPSFNVESDKAELAKAFSGATSISEYYRTDPLLRPDARNRFVLGRMVQIDLAYLQYIRALTSEKQNIDTATELANLTLNLAGTLVGGVRAKTNLAAAAAGLGGAKNTIDKEYYYEKSIDALVGTMNAKRKEVLVNILTGLNATTVEEYPFEVALTQLNEYYLAGTINGALRFINFQAAEQEKRSDARISEIPILSRMTPTQRTEATRLSRSLKDNPKLSVDGAKKALLALGADASKLPEEIDVLAPMLQNYIRKIQRLDDPDQKSKEIARITDIFDKAGILRAE